MGVSVSTVYYVAEDFKSGFIKNLVQARGGRASYAAVMILCSIVIAAVAVIIGMLVVEVALRVQGYVPYRLLQSICCSGLFNWCYAWWRMRPLRFF